MFNGLLYTEILEESGFTKKEATTLIRILVEIMNDEFATKHDLSHTAMLLKQDIKDFRNEVHLDFSKFRSEVREEFSNVRSEMKEEFSNVRSEMKEEFSNVRSEMKEEISELTNKLTIRLGLMMAGSFSIFLGIASFMKFSL